MYRRSWVLIFAVVGLAHSQIVWAAPLQEKGQHQQPVTTQKTPQQVPTPKAEVKRPDYNLASCYQSPDQQNADLCAQWRSAVAAEKAAKLAVWSNWITGFGAILSFASVLLVLRALKFARGANEIAANMGASQLRPWVLPRGVAFFSATNINVDGTTYQNGLVLHTEWKNTGQSPAVRSSLFVWHEMIKKEATVPQFNPPEQQDGTVTIPPDLPASSAGRAIVGDDLSAFMGRQKDIIVYSRVDYVDPLHRNERRFSECTFRCIYNGEKKESDGRTGPNIDVRAEGPQNDST